MLEYGPLPEPIGPHTHIWACSAPLCGYRTWAPKPKNGNIRRDLKGAHAILEHSDRPKKCEICLRCTEELPPTQVLEVHHVIEIENDGENTLDNLRWLCTECHAYVHHKRRYTVKQTAGEIAT